MPIDPLTAGIELLTAIVKLATLAIESQPPEVRAKLWELHIKDLLWWREFLKIDKP